MASAGYSDTPLARKLGLKDGMAVLPLGFVDVNVCAVSEVWSGLRLVVRKELR